MSFYQVNQRMSFIREFNEGYLCCPDGNYGGWQLMRGLERDDILFHYNSTHGAVLGISKVIDIGRHKGLPSETATVIQGTQCIRYRGRHLSDMYLTEDQRKRNRRYPSFLEVHTVPLLSRNLGNLLIKTPQVYLLQIDRGKAQRFIAGNGIRLDDLK